MVFSKVIMPVEPVSSIGPYNVKININFLTENVKCFNVALDAENENRYFSVF